MSKYYTVDEIMNSRCFGNNKICGIYKITCLKNNKIYIGSSKTMLIRWRNHIKLLNSGKHTNMFLQEDWDECGKDHFIFEVLEMCAESDRYNIEQKYLDKLFPFYRNGTGYNIAEKSTSRNETNVRLFKPKVDDVGLPIGDYYTVVTKGCKPRVLDGEHCRYTSREDLEWECFCLDETDRIMHNILCGSGGYDSWEW